MKTTLKALTWIFIVTAVITVSVHGEVRHAVDPRGNIENIVGDGDFVWNMDETKLADCKKEAKETGKEFNVHEIRWTVKGGGQDWVFTRITRMGEGKGAMVKIERFWITLLKVDGKWITRTKYRYREGEYKEGDSGEVDENDKGDKFAARSRITGKKIILALTRKKQGHIFKITGTDGFMQVSHIVTHDLTDRTINYKKR